MKHEHDWKQYIGLKDYYEYCTVCGKKWYAEMDEYEDVFIEAGLMSYWIKIKKIRK